MTVKACEALGSPDRKGKPMHRWLRLFRKEGIGAKTHYRYEKRCQNCLKWWSEVQEHAR